MTRKQISELMEVCQRAASPWKAGVPANASSYLTSFEVAVNPPMMLKLLIALRDQKRKNGRMRKALRSVRTRTAWRLREVRRDADVAANMDDIKNALR